jgi:ribosomal protein L11 methyltransferase
VLALAAVLLGAASALGIDNDPDAIAAARENLALNPVVSGVRFDVGDVSGLNQPADVVVANLTGAVLCRDAQRLGGAVRPEGRLILSGILEAERQDVLASFAGHPVVWQGAEDEWIALVLGPNVRPGFPV